MATTCPQKAPPLTLWSHSSGNRIISLDLKCVYQFMIIMVHNLFLKLSLFLLDLVPVFLFGCCCWIQIRQVFWLLFIYCWKVKFQTKLRFFLKFENGIFPMHVPGTLDLDYLWSIIPAAEHLCCRLRGWTWTCP